MTGWEKVAAATLVGVVGLLGLNISIWRRMRVAVTKAKADALRDHAEDSR